MATHSSVLGWRIPGTGEPGGLLSLGSHRVGHDWSDLAAAAAAAASTSVPPMNTQDWSPLGWTGWISLQSRGLSRVFSSTTVQKHQFFCAQLSLESNSYAHTCLLEKPQLWLQTVVGKVMSLLFNTLSRLVITFLPFACCLSIINSVQLHS